MKDSGRTYRYSAWLLHFCISVSWRTLKYQEEEGHLVDLGSEDLERVHDADRAWRAYLLGETKHPGKYRAHLLPFDQIETATIDLETNIHRYMLRAIQLDFLRGKGAMIAYTKLGRFNVFGFVHEQRFSEWRGSKVNANGGTVGPGDYSLPKAMAAYWKEKANKMSGALDGISSKQKAKIDRTFQDGVVSYIGSDAEQALSADIDMFGQRAFGTGRFNN